jgi:hypothetical protein
MRLERHATDPQSKCAPDTRPSDGTGCDGGPDAVIVCGACGVLCKIIAFSYECVSVTHQRSWVVVR